MTDRELLELAAKAAGVALLGPAVNGFFISDKYGDPVYWNPLTDDGDALRLAVKLGMTITAADIGATVDCEDVTRADVDVNDPFAATRRAIVRAAAEVGRNMK